MVTQLRDWFAKFGEPDPTQDPAPGDPATQVSAQDVSASLARIDKDILNAFWWLADESGAKYWDLKGRLINNRDTSVDGCTVFPDSGLDEFWHACCDMSTKFSDEPEPDMIFLSACDIGGDWVDPGETSISVTAFKREATVKEVVLYGTDPEQARYIKPVTQKKGKGDYDNLGFLINWWLDDQGGGGVPGWLQSVAGTIWAYRQQSGLARGWIPDEQPELSQQDRDEIKAKRDARLPATITE